MFVKTRIHISFDRNTSEEKKDEILRYVTGLGWKRSRTYYKFQIQDASYEPKDISAYLFTWPKEGVADAEVVYPEGIDFEWSKDTFSEM